MKVCQLLIGCCTAVILMDTVTAVTARQYKKTDKCNEKTCIYGYKITGEMHDKRGKEESEVTTEVTLSCESVGKFNDETVKRYCIEVKNMQASMFEKKQNRKKKNKEKVNANSIMKGWFCFLRNENGRILSVFHPPHEKTDIVNFKKTIVSAFQANFAKTSTEKETDAQSKHTAHYKYKKKGKDTVEHRTVSSKDVSKYAGKGSKKRIEFNSSEDIKVDESRIIKEAHGESKTSLTKENKKEEKVTGKNEDIPPIEAKSVYTLKLKKCVKASAQNELAWLNSETPSTIDSVMAQYNEYEHDKTEMEELYDELPELSETIQNHNRQSRDVSSNDEDHALSKWSQLLHLESKYGPLKGKERKVLTLINTLKQITSSQTQYHKDLRLTIYGLLSVEGSIQSQQALLNAMHSKIGTDEYNDIVMSITLLQAVDYTVLMKYKQYVIANGTTDEQLLLSLATLGRHKNVEQEVVDTITQLIEEQGVNDTDTLIYFIHALGNTGSRLIIPHLTPLLLNTDIQVTVIDALRTVSTDKRVQMMFSDLCRSSGVPVDTVLAIIESVRFPHESFLYYPESPEEPEDDLAQDELLSNIVSIVVHYNDSQLYNATKELLEYIGSDDLLNQLINPSNNDTRYLSKRARTSNWSSRNSLYNLVSSRSSRLSDKRMYPYNKAYLWGKKLGPSKIHMKLAVGGFGGVGLNGMKVFGKGVVNLYVFGRTVSVVHVEYLSRVRKGRDAYTKQYIKIFGSTLLQKSKTVPLPYRQNWHKNHFRVQVLRLRYRIFVWIGFLRFYIGASVSFDTTMAIKMDYREISAEVNIGPTFSVTGGASITLLIFFKVGLEIKASIGYYITPKGSVTLCDTSPVADASACFGIFHGSKGLFVDIYAYYRKRRCRFKGWRLRCRWGGMKRLRLFSSKFTFGRALRQRLLWGRCLACTCRGPMHNMCCAITGAPSTSGSGCSCKVARYS